MKYSNWWKIDWTWFDCIENSANLKQGGQYSNPWPGQYLTHTHSDITQAVAATDSCFILIGAHQCGKAIGLINGEKKFQQANARVGWKWSTQRLVEDRISKGLKTCTRLVDFLICITCLLEINAFSVLHYVMVALHYSVLHRIEIFSGPETIAHGPIRRLPRSRESSQGCSLAIMYTYGLVLYMCSWWIDLIYFMDWEGCYNNHFL